MRVELHIISTNEYDSKPSLLLFFDERRFLFNCGEGSQRLALQNKVRLARVDTMLLSRVCWNYVGGLAGMLLTVSDIGVTDFRIAAPAGLSLWAAAARFFVHRRQCTLHMREFYGASVVPGAYKDELVTIDAVLSDVRAAAPMHAHAAACVVDQSVPLVFEQLEQLKSASTAASGVASASVAASYVIVPCDAPRKFDVRRAKALNIPKGPMYGRLVRGETIQLDDGRTITPEDVLEAAQPSHVVVLLCVPSCDYIDSLCGNPYWSAWQRGGHSESRVYAVVHDAPLAVLRDARYMAFSRAFSATATHVLMHHNANALAPPLRGAYEHLQRLQVLGTNVFRAYGLRGDADPMPTEWSGDERLGARARAARAGQHIVLCPVRHAAIEEQHAHSAPPPSLSLDALPDVLRHELAALRNAPDAATLFDATLGASTATPEDPRITFIGTGSALPSKYRNVSAILIDMGASDAAGCFLLDVGEGTLGQMRRAFDADEYARLIRQLRFVWISHEHADHHLGLIGVLLERQRLLGGESSSSSSSVAVPPLHVVGPASVRTWLDEYARLEPLNFLFATFKEANEQRCASLHATLGAHAIVQLHSVPVRHCRDSHAVVVSHRGGWRIVYSGDCMPSERLAAAGTDATLLIHEATFEDGMEEDALAKTHSTTSQAIGVGERMGARGILLTHFSQRYPHVPQFDADKHGNVAVAFDLLSFRLSQQRALYLLTQLIVDLFDDDDAAEQDDDEERVDQNGSGSDKKTAKKARSKKAAAAAAAAAEASGATTTTTNTSRSSAPPPLKKSKT